MCRLVKRNKFLDTQYILYAYNTIVLLNNSTLTNYISSVQLFYIFLIVPSLPFLDTDQSASSSFP